MVGCQRTPTGVANLVWSVPSTNTDGTPLTDLAGYHIYYGRAPDSLNQVIVIRDPYTIHYSVTHLARGSWYFRLTSINSSGNESPMTPIVSYTVK